MAWSTNPVDGVRTYFEDSGGSAPAVLFYTGFADPLQVPKASGLARALSDEFRLIFADHRGQGGSDKPTDIAAYALATRAADAVAVLDSLNIDRAHFLGSSWGARLGFALGEYAPERLLSLVLYGNQPYEWDLGSPTAQGRRGCRRRFETRRDGRLRGVLRVVAWLSAPGAGPDVDFGEERPCGARGSVGIRPDRRTDLGGS
jgi:pimeloyl-ACP methyl ester carboxylesterase